MKQTYLKTASSAVKESPTAKSSAVKISPVEKVVTPGIYGKGNKVYLDDSTF